MPFNGSGTYVLPSGQPVSSGTSILASVFNTLTADLSNALNLCVTRDGQGTFTGQSKFFDGTVTAPGISYNAESSTGFYRASAGVLAISILGVQVANIAATGLTLTPTTANAGLVLVSANSATTSSADVKVTRAGSTVNAIGQGPNIGLYDTTNSTNTILQNSGGQTELWQYNGGWNQALYVPTTRGLVINAATSGNSLTVNGSIQFNSGTLTTPTSYGSFATTGVNGSWAGVQFSNSYHNQTLMVSTTSVSSGVYDVTAGAWQWRFDGGTLAVGTIPLATTATNWGSYGGVPGPGSSGSTANTIIRSDGSGYSYFGYINSTSPNNENPGVTQVITTSSDGVFYRKSSIASFTSYVQANASGSWGINISGTSAACSGNSATASSVTNNAGRTDGTAYPVVWATGATSPLYNCSAVTITSSSGTLTATAVSGTSDERLKKNIEAIPNALEKVSALTGVTFNWKESGTKATGLIAQNVREVIPEAVVEGEYLSVQYGNLVGLLVEAIKELKAEVDALKGR